MQTIDRLFRRLLDEHAGELPPDIRGTLDALPLDTSVKADPIARIVRQCEEEEALYKGQASQYTALAKTAARGAESLKAYLLERMETEGRKSIEGPRFVVSISKNSQPSIRWAGDGDPPEPFCRYKVELDSAKARVAYADGKLPEGFSAEVGRHLKITG